jgi:TonB-linked SusC/RagA family outer membrane protein
MKSFQTIRLTIFALAIVLTQASATPINGRVADAATGEAIIGASIIYNNKVGAVTDADGLFSIDVTTFPSELTISYVGYEQKNVRVKQDDDNVVVALQEENQHLDEIVVVGYGTQRRQKLTGSVVSVDRSILNNNILPTADGLLAGSVAGVSVTGTGQPGAASKIRIRGGNSVSANNEPLYVIDGFIYYKEGGAIDTGERGTAIEGGVSPLSLINPQDIESIEVLKDVSATAIYGSRGANGVVIVTTKKGQKGKAQIRYSYQLSLGIPAKKLSVMNAREWARYQKDYFYNKGGYTDAEIDALGEGTDWQSAVLRNTISHNHNLSISGGDDRTRYLVTGNIVRQEGILLNTGYQRSGLRVNIDRHVNDRLTIGATSNISRNRQDGLTTTTGVSFNSSPFQGGITNSLTYALLMPPVVPIYKADGSYNYSNPYEYAYFIMGDIAANPVSDLENSVAQTIDDDVIGNVFATYQLTDDLQTKATFGFDLDNLTQNYFAPHYTALGLANGGVGNVTKRRIETWQTEFTLTYDHQFGEAHHVDALAGYTYQSTNHTFLSASSSQYTDETLKHNNLSGGSQYSAPRSGESESNLHSLIGRVNYSLYDKYNMTATLRADRSSRFAKSHNWGIFPSLGLSWNIEKEHFAENVEWLNGLKLRASVGTVGNQEIGDYLYTTSYSTSTTGGQVHYTKTNAANDNLKWETTVSTNVGIDLSAFKNRLTFTAEVYWKRTNDLLLVVPVDVAKYGVSSQLQNVGNVENRGLELSLGVTPISHKDLRWTLAANAAWNTNRLTSLGNHEQLQTASYTILKKDEAVGSFYGLIFDGVVQKGEDTSLLPSQNGAKPGVGEAKFRDVNGDGKVDQNDRVILGHQQADLTFGLTSTLKWRQFDLFLQLQGATGGKVYNSLRRTLEHPTDCYNVSSVILDSWTSENPSNTLPKVSDVRPYSYIDDRYVEDADYLKLRTLSLGYRFRLKPVKTDVHLTATASNLFTLTGYKGYDPEVQGGIDLGQYPSARTFTLGIEITF